MALFHPHHTGHMERHGATRGDGPCSASPGQKAGEVVKPSWSQPPNTNVGVRLGHFLKMDDD